MSRTDLLQGTLEMLILKVLSLERIQQVSQEVFQVHQGSLYPALQRMRRKGLVRAEWRTTENNRRARYYELTPAGRKQLAEEKRTWERSSGAVNRILGMA